MPTARAWLAAAVVNDKIYVIGGHDHTGYLSTNEAYNPSTDSWTTKTPMPTARAWLAAAVVNDKIYAIGGNIYLSTNEEYTPTSLTLYWFQKQ
jgi:Kelch motif.